MRPAPLAGGVQLCQGQPVHAHPAGELHGTGRALPPQQRFRGQKALVAGLLAPDVGCCLGDDPEPDGRGKCAEGVLGKADFRAGPLHQIGECAFCHVLQIVGVQLQDGRRPGQRFSHSGPELFLQQRQHFHPGPGPGEGRIRIAGIVPRLQLLNVADLQGVLAAQAQEGPEQQAAGRPHSGQRARPGTAGQAEEDLFCLIVQRVAQQDGGGALFSRRCFQGCMAGIAGCRLRAHAGGRYLDGPDLHRGEAQFLQGLGGGRSHLGRPLLQLVVHHHGAHRQRVPVNVAAAGKVGCDGGERQGIRPAAAGHQHVGRIAGLRQGVLEHFARFANDGRQPAGPPSAACVRRLVSVRRVVGIRSAGGIRHLQAHPVNPQLGLVDFRLGGEVVRRIPRPC